MGQKMCDFFPPAGYWLTPCTEKISRDSEAQLNNILSLDVYQNSGKTRPGMDSFLASLPTFSVFIGLDYLGEECPGDWDQLDLTDEVLQEQKTSNQGGRVYAIWSCRERVISAAESQTRWLLLLQIQRALAFLLLVVLWIRDLQGCRHAVTSVDCKGTYAIA